MKERSKNKLNSFSIEKGFETHLQGANNDRVS